MSEDQASTHNIPPANANSALATLTIEYVDAQGQLQRTEHLQGSQFTLRVLNGSTGSAESAEPLQIDLQQAPPDRAALQPHTATQKPAQAFLRLNAIAWAFILLAVYGLLSFWQGWLAYNPDEDSRNYVIAALGLLGGVTAWAAIWALLSKIIAKHAFFWQHACRVLLAGVVASFVMLVMHYLAFMMGWYALGRMDKLILVFMACLLLWAHLSLVVPASRGTALRLGMAAFTATALSLVMWINQKNQDTMLDTLHSPHLSANQWQLYAPKSSTQFIDAAKNLENQLKDKAAITEPGEEVFDGAD